MRMCSPKQVRRMIGGLRATVSLSNDGSTVTFLGVAMVRTRMRSRRLPKRYRSDHELRENPARVWTWPTYAKNVNWYVEFRPGQTSIL
jgi:hypothetical protein